MREIRIDTFAKFLEHGYCLDCRCPGCRRWASCNLAMLVSNGLGERLAYRGRPRCRKCGALGQWQIRPPVPQFTGDVDAAKETPARGRGT